MPRIQFLKIEAAHKDFILVTDPEDARPLSSEDVVRLCDRRLGIGADGVIRMVRSKHLPEGQRVLQEAPEAEWFMDLATSNGTTEALSGNGLRAMARALTDSGLVELPAGETLAIGTRVGVRDVQRNSTGGFQVDLGRWRLAGGEPTVHARGLTVPRQGLGVEVGTPFVVVALSSLAELELLDLRTAPELDPEIPLPVSVCFVVPGDPLVRNGVGQLRMRVYQRELGETRSGGTAAAATALAVRHWAGSAAPHHWRVESAGEPLQVRMFPTEEGEHLGLAGGANLTFTGQVNL